MKFRKRHHPQARPRQRRAGLLGRARGLLARAFDEVCALLGDPAANQRLADARRRQSESRFEPRYRGGRGPRQRQRRGPPPGYGRRPEGPYPLHFVPSPQDWPWQFLGREAPWPPAPGSYYHPQQQLSPHMPPGVRLRQQAGDQGRFTGRGPRNYARPDARIVEDINELLTYSPHVDASDIDVRVLGGEVTVIGRVDDRYLKRLVEDLIDDVTGVRDIQNELRVERTPSHGAGNVERGQPQVSPRPRVDVTSGSGIDEAEASSLNTSRASRQRDEGGGFSGT